MPGTAARDNPLFTAGDVLYDGMILREIPELPILHVGDTGEPSTAARAISVAHRPSASPGHNGRKL